MWSDSHIKTNWKFHSFQLPATVKKQPFIFQYLVFAPSHVDHQSRNDEQYYTSLHKTWNRCQKIASHCVVSHFCLFYVKQMALYTFNKCFTLLIIAVLLLNYYWSRISSNLDWYDVASSSAFCAFRNTSLREIQIGYWSLAYALKNINNSLIINDACDHCYLQLVSPIPPLPEFYISMSACLANHYGHFQVFSI